MNKVCISLTFFSAILIRDKGKNKSRGFGFVTFENPLDGEDAAKELDGSVSSDFTFYGFDKLICEGSRIQLSSCCIVDIRNIVCRFFENSIDKLFICVNFKHIYMKSVWHVDMKLVSL